MSTMASSFGSKVSNIHSMTIHLGSVTLEHSWKQARVNVMSWGVNLMSCGVNIIYCGVDVISCGVNIVPCGVNVIS
jgi:hypothetical protein